MGKADFINGTVLEFKVPLDFGFAYCKIIDFRYIRQFDGVLAKVYNHITKEPIKDIQVLSDKDYLFGARRLMGLPNTRGRNAWKYKGVLVCDDDKVIPDFKYSHKSSPFKMDESQVDHWEVVRNINEYSDHSCTHDQVKHLENTRVDTHLGIEIRTAMEYCRIHDMDVTKYFNVEDPLYLGCYQSMINVPIYSTIPKEIRGKGQC
jgi:hypothetical protein